MNKTLYICLVIVTLGFANCTNYTYLNSNPPGAELFAYDKKSASYKKVGALPTNLTRQVLKNTSEKMVKLKIEQKGVLPTFLLFPVSFNPGEEQTVLLSERETFYTKLQKLTSALYEVQQEIAKKNISKAQQKLTKLKKEFSYIAAVHIHQAQIDLLKNNSKVAARNVQKALDLTPNNKYYIEFLEQTKHGKN